ncbi:MAG TPA: nucleotidyltransferase domain-containing protein [Prolixibacteraceae bacterium]|nr:nucleotidyltransferase domain-containing protein [Prolixibacteraceae bacterium]
MKRHTKHIIHLVKKRIAEIDPLADVILFGSRARGDEKADSDWDVLILTNYPVDLITERKFRNELYNLELETGEPFSVFAYSKKDWNTRQKVTPFYRNVTKEGVLI